MTHTPQEKLAAVSVLQEMRAAAKVGLKITPEILTEWERKIATLLSEHGEVVVTTDQAGRCVAVTRQDSEGRILSTIWEAPEHGGGGEAVACAIAAVKAAELFEDGVEADLADAGITTIADAFMEGRMAALSELEMELEGEAVKATTPPTPSAPVVDDAVQDACDEILNRLEGWSKAYPEDIFHEPTKAEREWLHATKPGLMDCIAASMGRHMSKMIASDLAALQAAIQGAEHD